MSTNRAPPTVSVPNQLPNNTKKQQFEQMTTEQRGEPRQSYILALVPFVVVDPFVGGPFDALDDVTTAV